MIEEAGRKWWTLGGGYKILQTPDGRLTLLYYGHWVVGPVEDGEGQRERLEKVAEKDGKINALEARRDSIERRLHMLWDAREELIREAGGDNHRGGPEGMEAVLTGAALTADRRPDYALGDGS